MDKPEAEIQRYDIIRLTEIWLNDSTKQEDIMLRGTMNQLEKTE